MYLMQNIGVSRLSKKDVRELALKSSKRALILERSLVKMHVIFEERTNEEKYNFYTS